MDVEYDGLLKNAHERESDGRMMISVCIRTHSRKNTDGDPEFSGNLLIIYY